MNTSIDIKPALGGPAPNAQRCAMNAPLNGPKPLTEGRFCDWIATAKPGQALQYHEGLLLWDRAEATSTLAAKDRARLHAVARRAWIACELGLVHLFSQKVEEHHYRYLAVRSRNALKPADIRIRLRQVPGDQPASKSH